MFGERILFYGFPFFFPFFFSRSKWKRNDNSIWLWPRAMTFVKCIVIECCVFLLAMTERWVVLIHRPHAVKLRWHCASDKPLLSSVCASDGRKRAEALPGVGPAGRPQLDSRDWHQHATLSGAAFMWLRELRGSGFANLIYSPRLAAASEAGGCHPIVHMERCS